MSYEVEAREHIEKEKETRRTHISHIVVMIIHPFHVMPFTIYNPEAMQWNNKSKSICSACAAAFLKIDENMDLE